MRFSKVITVLMILTTVSKADVEEIDISECPTNTLPQRLLLKMTVVELNLEHEGRRMAGMEVGERGRLKKWKGRHSELFGLYSDAASGASFSVAVSPKTIMYGSFSHNEDFYTIRPIPSHYRPHHRPLHHSHTSLIRKISICGSTHLLERHPPTNPPHHYSSSSTMNLYDDVVVDRLKISKAGGRREQGASSHHFIMSEQQFKLLKATHSPMPTQHLTVELYVVIDYSIYKHWLELHRTSDRAITDLRYYYSHIINGMSKRYEALAIPGVELSVSIAGFYIAKSRKDAPFTDSAKVRINSTTIDVYRALDHFFEWVREKVIEQPPSLPRFDAAMLFTRQTLGVRNNETKQVRTISGLADIGALCQVNSVSIVKDFGVHGTLDTATHELAHNLGANHDGSGNDCYSSRQYIMALAPNKVADDLYNNTLSFSQCSKNDFVKYIAKLNKSERNCMVDGWGSEERGNVTSMLEHFPGRNYSLDQQCRLIFGRESFFCGGGGNLIRDLCKEMFCYRPTSRSCKTDVQLKAADGTPCDHKAWCQGGHCTAAEEAPEFDNTCPFGDFKDKIPLYEAGHIFCKQITHKDPTLCYNHFYAELCCETCGKLNTKIKGCEYGDRNISKCSRIQPIQCYGEGIREECCQACELKKPKDLPTDCTYGDRADWCRNTSIFNPLNCYTPQDSHVCCQTCQKYNTGPEGCEFGDRGTGCIRENCVNTNYWLYCCHTCALFINADEFAHMYALQRSTPTPPPSTTTAIVASHVQQLGGKQKWMKDVECTKDKAGWCMMLSPPQCYNAHQTCCRKCLEFYQPDKIGCEYGDKSYDCDASNCEGESYIDTCCDTCSAVFRPQVTTSLATTPPTKPPTRPPPQKAATHTITVHRKATTTTTTTPHPPQRNDQTTVASTNTNNTTSPYTTQTTFVYPVACPKGDRAEWCGRIQASQCYKSQETCCHSCAQFYNPSIQGCEYGDKASWCENHVAKQARDCSRPSSSVASNCCHSCAHYKQATEEMEEHREDRGVEWLCKAGDQASYCATLTHAYSCYSYRHICCAACTRFLDHSIPDCPFGDRVSWCARYRNDEMSCRRRDIGAQCCKTCAPFIYNGKMPKSALCKDQASWCRGLKPSQCYHATAQSTCCASCHHFADGNEGDCRYGDKLSWCEPQFCGTNAKECCKTCGHSGRS